MRALDALVPSRSPMEHRYSWQQYLSDLISKGGSGTFGVQTTYGNQPSESIADNFISYVAGGLRGNSIISTIELLRSSVFAEARFQWQALTAGRPGKLFGTADLAQLETPWPGGTTADLLARMIIHADLAGNSYVARVLGQLVVLRPDWVDILLAPRMAPVGPEGRNVQVGFSRAGYVYWEGGKAAGAEPALFLPDEMCHFAPLPDPLATYRGMSWMTPVLREIQADISATQHKLKFFENGATPNLVVSLAKEITPKAYDEFVERMNARIKGIDNAYETLWLGGGADATVVGSDMKQIDFKVTQGAGETRMANAAGCPAVLLGLSEGMQGSSLNAGNYNSAKRRFADATMRPLWRNAAGSLQTLFSVPAASRLWYDGRDVAFLRDDESQAAEIQSKRAQTIKALVDSGYDPDSVTAAVEAEDFALLVHSGLYSVQLQPPGAGAPAA